MSSRKFICVNSPDKFCYICGDFIIGVLVKINPQIKLNYLKCFGIVLHDDTQDWSPSNVCRHCEYMISVAVDDLSKLKFNVPRMWREPATHPDACYFCSINVRMMNKKKLKSLVYPNLESAIRTMYIENWIPRPIHRLLMEAAVDAARNDNRLKRMAGDVLPLPPPVEETDDASDNSSDEEYEDLNVDEDDYSPKPDEKFSTIKLNDLIRNFGHSKNMGWKLAQDLKLAGCLQTNININRYF
jgi:hypothetical protein